MPSSLEVAKIIYGGAWSVPGTQASYGEPQTVMRTGTVTAVNPDGTVTVTIDNTGEQVTVTTDVPLAVGDRVTLLIQGGKIVVHSYTQTNKLLDGRITGTDMEYATSKSPTEAPTTGWTTDPPVMKEGEYLWQRLVTMSPDGKSYSTPVCISVSSDGSVKALTGVREQYYLSTSSTTQAGGTWSYQQVAWQSGRYIWARSELTWTDGSVTYTDPILARALNALGQAAQNAVDVAKNAQKLSEATGQHFWYDDSGAHVSTAENSVSGGNSLMNSNGFFVRNGTTVRSAFTDSQVLLGADNQDAIIDMCKSMARVRAVYDSTFGTTGASFIGNSNSSASSTSAVSMGLMDFSTGSASYMPTISLTNQTISPQPRGTFNVYNVDTLNIGNKTDTIRVHSSRLQGALTGAVSLRPAGQLAVGSTDQRLRLTLKEGSNAIPSNCLGWDTSDGSFHLFSGYIYELSAFISLAGAANVNVAMAMEFAGTQFVNTFQNTGSTATAGLSIAPFAFAPTQTGWCYLMARFGGGGSGVITNGERSCRFTCRLIGKQADY